MFFSRRIQPLYRMRMLAFQIGGVSVGQTKKGYLLSSPDFFDRLYQRFRQTAWKSVIKSP